MNEEIWNVFFSVMRSGLKQQIPKYLQRDFNKI